MPLAEFGALVGAAQPGPHAGLDQMPGIDNDDVLQARGGIAVS